MYRDWRVYLEDIILIHEYFGVSVPMVWDIAQNKLTPLKAACLELLHSDDDSQRP